MQSLSNPRQCQLSLCVLLFRDSSSAHSCDSSQVNPADCSVQVQGTSGATLQIRKPSAASSQVQIPIDN
jgi:hypothetical protein